MESKRWHHSSNWSQDRFKLLNISWPQRALTSIALTFSGQFLSNPCRDCSKSHHSPQVPCGDFPASCSLRWSHRTLFQRQNKWSSLECFILCPLHQKSSPTHLTLTFSFQHPRRRCSSFCSRHTLPDCPLSYSLPSVVLQLLTVQILPLLDPFPTAEKHEQVLWPLRLSPIPMSLPSSYCPLLPSFSKPSIWKGLFVSNVPRLYFLLLSSRP